MSGYYTFASPFLIRSAGIPFDIVEGLATSNASCAARNFLAADAKIAPLKKAAHDFVTCRDNGLGADAFTAWRNAIRRSEVPQTCGTTPEALREYAAAAATLRQAHLDLETELQRELATSRRALQQASQRMLGGYLVFSAAEANRVLSRYSANGELPQRTSRVREHERHLLLYLQRIAAKNDTFSQFGPSAWGKLMDDTATLKFHVEPGIGRRQAFLERWTAHALAARINADPDAYFELKPRPNPEGVLVGNKFIDTSTAQSIELDDAAIALLERCDGATAIYDLTAGDHHAPGSQTANVSPGANGVLETIRDLVSKRILVAGIEVAALEPFAFELLRQDIEKWRRGTARERWLPIANDLSELTRNFLEANDTAERTAIMSEARERLSDLGAKRARGERSLYAAANPIAEECCRECDFEIGRMLLDRVAVEAAPWIDLWRDSYAFVASRVAANLRQIIEKAPTKDATLPLSAFLRLCEAAKLPLTGPGLVGLAHVAFQEVKSVFREQIRPHGHLPEYELTVDDCAVVRRRFEYAPFDELTYPSADLQLAARSVEAVNRGEYTWIVGELHPAIASLHHCMHWSCPDPDALSRALRSIAQNKPMFHFGFLAADFTAHTTVRIFDALPQLTTFVAPQRANPDWKRFSPAETEVYVDENTGDVRLRHSVTGEDLGSFARNWIIPLGFHPFQFSGRPQMPRLRCGRVVVQRRSWTVTADELKGEFSGVSRQLILAIEKLRADRGLPRFIFIRPTEQALRRSGAEGRDKDTKPVFVDLESYLFLEIFQRWLAKAGELEVTEMLPRPDELCWQEADGRHTFELRTLVLPR